MSRSAICRGSGRPASIRPRAHGSSRIITGTAYDGKADLRLTSPDTDPKLTLVNATATLDGDNLAITWLTGVPPIEQAKGHLVLTDPDKIEVDLKSARQKVNGGDPIALQNGHITITGVAHKDQVLTVRLASGSIPSALSLLKEPRLHLLDRHPMDLRSPSGDARINLQAVVPLELNLKADEITVRGSGTRVRTDLTSVVAGRDLDDGNFSFDGDNNHFSLKGTGRVAGIQANIDGMMDFRPGAPDQVTMRLAANGTVTAPALAQAGLDTQGALSGEAGMNVVLNEYRDGSGEVTADADLTQAGLLVSPLAWRKPVGAAARASAHLTLANDKLTAIDRVTIDGTGMQALGAVTVFDGKPDTVRLDRLVLGRTDLKGTIRLPREGPIGIDLAGPALDISAKVLEKPAKRTAATAERPGPEWSLRARFAQVLLAHNQFASQVVATADNDGRVYRGLSVVGRTGSGKPIRVQIGRPVGPAAAGPTAGDRAAGDGRPCGRSGRGRSGRAAAGDQRRRRRQHAERARHHERDPGRRADRRWRVRRYDAGTYSVRDLDPDRLPREPRARAGQVVAGGDTVWPGRCVGRAGPGVFPADRAVSV